MKTRSQKMRAKSLASKPKDIQAEKKNVFHSKVIVTKTTVQTKNKRMTTRSQNFADEKNAPESRLNPAKKLSATKQNGVNTSGHPIGQIGLTPVMNEAKKLSAPKTDGMKAVDSANRAKHLKSISRSKQNEQQNKQLMEFCDYRVFIVGDLVWAKLRGWPAWPAKVTKIVSFVPFKVEVLFFNDGRTAVLFSSQIEHLLPGFKNNAQKVMKNEAINKAAKEAMIAYFFSKNLHHNV